MKKKRITGMSITIYVDRKVHTEMQTDIDDTTGNAEMLVLPLIHAGEDAIEEYMDNANKERVGNSE